MVLVPGSWRPLSGAALPESYLGAVGEAEEGTA